VVIRSLSTILALGLAQAYNTENYPVQALFGFKFGQNQMVALDSFFDCTLHSPIIGLYYGQDQIPLIGYQSKIAFSRALIDTVDTVRYAPYAKSQFTIPISKPINEFTWGHRLCTGFSLVFTNEPFWPWASVDLLAFAGLNLKISNNFSLNTAAYQSFTDDAVVAFLREENQDRAEALKEFQGPVGEAEKNIQRNSSDIKQYQGRINRLASSSGLCMPKITSGHSFQETPMRPELNGAALLPVYLKIRAEQIWHGINALSSNGISAEEWEQVRANWNSGSGTDDRDLVKKLMDRYIEMYDQGAQPWDILSHAWQLPDDGQRHNMRGLLELYFPASLFPEDFRIPGEEVTEACRRLLHRATASLEFGFWDTLDPKFNPNLFSKHIPGGDPAKHAVWVAVCKVMDILLCGALARFKSNNNKESQSEHTSSDSADGMKVILAAIAKNSHSHLLRLTSGGSGEASEELPEEAFGSAMLPSIETHVSEDNSAKSAGEKVSAVLAVYNAFPEGGTSKSVTPLKKLPGSGPELDLLGQAIKYIRENFVAWLAGDSTRKLHASEVDEVILSKQYAIESNKAIIDHLQANNKALKELVDNIKDQYRVIDPNTTQSIFKLKKTSLPRALLVDSFLDYSFEIGINIVANGLLAFEIVVTDDYQIIIKVGVSIHNNYVNRYSSLQHVSDSEIQSLITR
jgi:hypothetical protein